MFYSQIYKGSSYPWKNWNFAYYVFTTLCIKIKGNHLWTCGNHEAIPQMKRLNEDKGGWKHHRHTPFMILWRIFFHNILHNQRHGVHELSSSFHFISMIKQVFKMYENTLGEEREKDGEIVVFVDWLPFCRLMSNPQTIIWEEHLH